MRTETPCYMCEKRITGCHAFCEDYGAWSAERTKALQEQFAAKTVINAANGVAIARSIRLKKKKE